MEFLINLLYSIAGNLYIGSSDALGGGSSSADQQTA